MITSLAGRPSARQFLLYAVIAAAVLVGLQASAARAGSFVSESDYDFDCDGVRDLLVVRTGEVVNGVAGAGAVTVTYSKTGESRKITQATPGVPGSPEKEDWFGYSRAAYDRNQDGCDDLVVGAPYEDIGSRVNAGMVWFIPGSPSGLDPAKSEGYTQNSTGYRGVAEDWDWFGWSLAAGVSDQGAPYLLIGSPGESGPSSDTWTSGSVYYVRSGSVKVITQDSRGVAGKRETGDSFGKKLATSDRYFVIGSPEESLRGSVWDEPPSYDDGMINVFSHRLRDGRPTPVAGVTQDTAGISGAAEDGDNFGWSVSVAPYRPSSSASVGALIGVGSWETVGTKREAGMAHLLYVSPGGDVRQLAAVTQGTPGVTGSPESGDYLGHSVVVANLNQDSAVAEPHTAVWAVGVPYEETASGNTGATHVFRATWQRGDPDIWLEMGRHGLPAEDTDSLAPGRASATYLHIAVTPRACFALPWKNMLDVSGWDPVIEREDHCV